MNSRTNNEQATSLLNAIHPADILDYFDQWMLTRQFCNVTHVDLLLNFVDSFIYTLNKSPHIEPLSHFQLLHLAQAAADRGYKTAIDLPMSENAFKYRNHIKKFIDTYDFHSPRLSDAEKLLSFLASNPYDCTIDDYDEYMILCRLLADEGYLTTIDIPISKNEFDNCFLKKFREFADALKDGYLPRTTSPFFYNTNPRHQFALSYVQLVQNQEHKEGTGPALSRQYKKLLENELAQIKSEYIFSSPNQSLLYKLALASLDERSPHNNYKI